MKPGPIKQGGLLDYFVRHKTAANLLLMLMLLAGVMGGLNLRAQFFPDIVREQVTVSVAWQGAGAADVDEGIVTTLEPSLLAVEGVEEAISTSREGSASIALTFEDGWDMGRASDDVQAAVDSVSTLPAEAEDPNVRRSAFRDRVLDVAITGGVGVDRLTDYADEFTARLFQAGVPRTSVTGVPEGIIRVSVPEEARLRHDLTLREVADAVSAGVTGTPSGDVDASASRVRAGVDKRSVEEIGDTILRSGTDGSQLRLRDVAHVVDAGFENGQEVFRGGVPTLIVSVLRDANGDSLKIQKIADEVIAEMAPTLPEGVEIVGARSRAEPIYDRLEMLTRNGVTGLALVLALLFLFLSARTAIWVAAGIPISIAATVAIMYVSGQTLNMISMFGMIISLGIIVDDAIVVGEHADDLARKGVPPAEAATRAARRMAGPVVSASITTVIAFSALVFIGGRFGALLAAIPFVVSAVIIASLIESFLILPNHMKHALSAKNKTPWYDAPSRAFNRGFVSVRERFFRPLMTWAIRLRYLTLSFAVALLLYSWGLFAGGSVKWEFFSRPEQGTLSANVIMDAAATRADTKAMLDEMDRALGVVNERYAKEFGTAPVDFAQATLGANVGWRFSAGDNKDKDLLGGFQAALIDADLRPYSSYKFLGDWDSEINASPLVESLSIRSARSGPGGDAIDVKFTGADAFTLKAAAEALKAGLADSPGVSGLDDTLVYDKTELILSLTPRGEALGFTTRTLGAELRARLNGIEAAEFAKDARQITVRVQPPEGEVGANYLEATYIRAPSGAVLTLGEVATVTTREGFAAIRRENGLRVATVTGEVDEDLTGAAAAVREDLDQRLLPAIAAEYGVAYDQGGLREQENDFLSDALTGFGLALAGIYLTLTWVFASWTRPFVVMLVIPFGFIGAVWGHYWMGLSFSMFSIVGLIGMAGIIINDSIVLVTTIDEHSEERGMIPSIIDGATDRLRAVVLTTLTTVGGLAPLLFETSRQALFLKPTVVTLAFGLGFGVVLVLLVTPAVVAVEHDIRMAIKSFRHALSLPARNRREKARFGRYVSGPRGPGAERAGQDRHPIPAASPEPSREAATRAAE